MSYCTQSDLITRFGSTELIQLTDRSGAGVIDTTVLGTAIADAEAEINEKLVGLLPLTTVPAKLVRVACDIARYFLYKDQAPELIQSRYKDAMAYLTNVAGNTENVGADSTGIAIVDTADNIEFQINPVSSCLVDLNGY